MSTAHNEDYRILIRSVSEQFEHTEPLPAEETDKIELMTYGSFLKKAGSYYISYKETETIGFAGCTTTIKIAEDGSRVALLRFGKVNTQLVIQREVSCLWPGFQVYRAAASQPSPDFFGDHWKQRRSCPHGCHGRAGMACV